MCIRAGRDHVRVCCIGPNNNDSDGRDNGMEIVVL